MKVHGNVVWRNGSDRTLAYEGPGIDMARYDDGPGKAKWFDHVRPSPQHPVTLGRGNLKLAQEKLGHSAGPTKAEPSAVKKNPQAVSCACRVL